jgi:hypothetical protein
MLLGRFKIDVIRDLRSASTTRVFTHMIPLRVHTYITNDERKSSLNTANSRTEHQNH